MQTVTLTAHFDGERIQLDEPFPLLPDTQLLVTVLPKKMAEIDREAWMALAKSGLSHAYSEDEPDYSANLIRSPAA